MISDNSGIRDAGNVLRSYVGGGASGSRESYGGYDLTDYSNELAKSGLAISEVRLARYNERIDGRNVAHDVLIVTSFNNDYTSGQSTGVQDYLEHVPGNNSNRYGMRDVVNRDMINSNGVAAYGGIDQSGTFQMNVELRPDARGGAGMEGRDVWRPNADQLTLMTSSLIYDPGTFRDVVAQSIALNGHLYPDPEPNPDLGPGRHYNVKARDAAPIGRDGYTTTNTPIMVAEVDSSRDIVRDRQNTPSVGGGQGGVITIA